ncbi:MAG: hypothetical protein WCF68_03820 [Terriglobales bacterium]
MQTFDPAGAEFLRISEHYRRMTDEELQVLIPQSSELTPFAQQALANEVRSRGLKAEPADEKLSPPSPFKPPPAFFERESPKFRDEPADDSSSSDSPESDSSEEDNYDEDRKLVELCTVWSLRDALKVQEILDASGIPCFMGKEKATTADKVTSNFANGVSVQIMQIGLPWARSAMAHYEPEDDPTPIENEEPEELVVRCPKCHSTEVVFEGTDTLVVATDDSTQKYKWTCDACGNQWEDDGVAQEE